MRGIVFTAGGETYYSNALANCALLRRHGCSLPIEWFYLGKEMRPEWIERASKIPGVKLIDLGGEKTDNSKFKGGWQSKSVAMLASSFDEILYLDADCFTMKDPEYLFDTTQYKEYGSIFLPDLARWSSKRWEILGKHFGLSYIDGWEFEGGAMLIDKRRCIEALKLCNEYNQDPFTYKILFGDKDTFYMAWRKTNTPFYQIQKPTYVKSGKMLIQHDPYGFPLYRHLTGSKLSLCGEYTVSYKDFPFRSFCSDIITGKNTLENPQSITKNDIAVMVTTGSGSEDRKKAVTDTWYRSIPNVMFTEIKEDYRLKSLSELDRWKNILKQFPDKKWYMRIDDDSYLRIDPLVTELSKLDPNKPYYCGDFDQWRGHYSNVDDTWISGGSGLILSRPAIEMLIKRYDPAYEHLIQPKLNDIFIGRYMEWLNIPPTNIKGMYQILEQRNDFISMHQVGPEVMRDIHNGKLPKNTGISTVYGVKFDTSKIYNVLFGTSPLVIHAPTGKRDRLWKEMSAIIPNKLTPVISKYNYEIITWNNGEFSILEKCIKQLGLSCTVLGKNIPKGAWSDFINKKIELTLNHIKKSKADYIIGLDAIDVILLGNPDDIIDRMKSDIVFAATKNKWPADNEIRIDDIIFNTKYKYLNAGCWVAKKDYAIEFFTKAIEAQKYLDGPFRMNEQSGCRYVFRNEYPRAKIDMACEIFQVLCDEMDISFGYGVGLDTRDNFSGVFNAFGFKEGAEIGVYRGEFSKKICEKWKGKLHLIDTWQGDDMLPVNENDYKIALANTKGFDVNIIRNTSKKASELFKNGSLDFVYIDASHHYESVKEDIKLWMPKVRKGGLICGHDYSRHSPNNKFDLSQVKAAVKDVLGDVFYTNDILNTSWYKII